MKNLFKFIGAAVLGLVLLTMPVLAQNYTGNPGITNVMPVNLTELQFTNNGGLALLASNPVVVVQGPRATLWLYAVAMTNSLANTIGAGSLVATIAGSPNTTSGPFAPIVPPIISPFTETATNNPLTCTVYVATTNVINATQATYSNGGYLVGTCNFDASGLGSVTIWSLNNTCTNMIMTNIMAYFTFSPK